MTAFAGDDLAREWAARYVAYGWALVPVVPRGKEPFAELLAGIYGDTRTQHLKDAPAFIEEVLYWFDNDPAMNLAVFPSASLGLVIADFDDMSFVPDLRTATVQSGRVGGGRHLYFAHERLVPRTRTIWGHINPEYAVLPGSVHASGATYEWLPGLSPEDVPLMAFSEAADALGVERLLEG